jgi:hypothetical protein
LLLDIYGRYLLLSSSSEAIKTIVNFVLGQTE